MTEGRLKYSSFYYIRGSILKNKTEAYRLHMYKISVLLFLLKNDTAEDVSSFDANIPFYCCI